MKSKLRGIGVLTMVLLAVSPAGTQTPGPLSAERIAKLETTISSFMSQQNIPGMTVAVVMDNQIRFQRGYGMADVENFVPAKVLHCLSNRVSLKSSDRRRGDAAGRKGKA
jgi:CubicO group peptidase (beta-lactamase class C family)